MLLIAFGLGLPFLAVDFPPLTDLPQHMNQGRLLLGEAWQKDSPYQVDLFTPYTMTYAFVVAALALFDPLQAVAAAMLLLSLAWTAAVLLRRNRAIVFSAGTVLALGFFYNQSLYWGLIHHVFGACFFLGFVRLLQRSEGRRGIGWIAVYGVVAFFVHVYWVVFSAVFIAARFLMRPALRRTSFFAGLAMLPGCAVVLLWLTTRPEQPVPEYGWLLAPWERIAPGPLVRNSLGGIKHGIEDLYFVLAALFCLAVAWTGFQRSRRLAREQSGASEHQDSRDGRNGWDRDLLLAAGLCFLWALSLPDGNSSSTLVAVRWMPYACAFLLIAAPPLPFGDRRGLNRISFAVAAFALIALVGITTAQWRKFEQREYAGFMNAIRSLPEDPSVLGLSFYQSSEYIHGYPFFHSAAYGQLIRGGRIHFSFADFPFCPVAHRSTPHPWTPRLEFYPQRLQKNDLQYFTHVLIGAPEQLHAKVAQEHGLTPVTKADRWRLYRTRE